MTVDLARPADLVPVMNVLDGADLQIAATDVDSAIDHGLVLVARSEARTVLGAIVGRPEAQDGHVGPSRERDVRIVAIAVRPGRRGQGIGTALVEAAGDRWGPLTAAFDPGLETFYRKTGFDVVSGERLLGRWHTTE